MPDGVQIKTSSPRTRRKKSVDHGGTPADSPSSPRVGVWDLFGKAVTGVGFILIAAMVCTMITIVVGIVGSVLCSISSCAQSISSIPESLANIDLFSDEAEQSDVPISADSTQPVLSKAAVLEWLRVIGITPSDNGWERVLMEGTHSSPGKYGCEFITNCSLLGDCVIELAPLDGQTKLSSHGMSMYNGRSFLLDQEKRSIEWIVEYSSGTQSTKVSEAQLLYLWRRPSELDQYRDTPLGFQWKLVARRSKEVVRKAFKRDFQPPTRKEELCDFTILPFQMQGSDGSPIRLQFDLSVTFTRLLASKARPTVDTPKPNQELLEAFPSVIKMVTVDNDKEEEREIFSCSVVENSWRISSEEIRERWLNPDEHKLGKIVVVIRQPLTVHIAYCVRGERW